MRHGIRFQFAAAVLALGAFSAGPAALGRTPPFDPFAAAKVAPHFGAPLPATLAFRDEAGRTVRTGALTGDTPVILAPVYYDCPNMCSATLARLFASLSETRLRPGADFRLIAVSIDPREGPAQAAAAKARALTQVPAAQRPEAARAARFLTGDQSAIAALTAALGFYYAWSAEAQAYAHPAGLFVLTPDGRIGRWLNSLDYTPRDLRLALVETGEGGIGSLGDRILLLCCPYDPKTGRYSGLVQTALQVAGGASAAALAGGLGFAVLREKRASRRRGGGR